MVLIGGLFFLYTLLCGINYHSTPFSEKNDMKLQQYTVEELASYCKERTDEVNVLSGKVNRRLLANRRSNEEKAVQAMGTLGDQMNDVYLKANKQTDGVLSYDRMVDLLMAEYLNPAK